jgi:hypothetical protein
MVIDVRSIMRSNYASCYKLHREEELDEKRKILGEKELNAGLSQIVVGVPDAIQNTLEYATSLDQFLLVIPKIRENIFNPEKQKAAQTITYSYNDIHDFLNRDVEGVKEMLGRKAKITPEKMPAYLDCMYEIVVDCVEFCLDKFRRDIESYRAENHVTWAQKSEIAQIVDRKHHEGQKVKKRGFEDLRDNEGSRKDWRDRITANKKVRADKKNEGFNIID